jgi:hypothetical protein
MDDVHQSLQYRRPFQARLLGDLVADAPQDDARMVPISM